MCVDCITVALVNEVLTLHLRQRKTVDDRFGKRYGSPVSRHLGQVKPAGQRIVSRYLAQASSFGNTCWNSGRLVGKPRESISNDKAKFQFGKQPDKQASFVTCLPSVASALIDNQSRVPQALCVVITITRQEFWWLDGYQRKPHKRSFKRYAM